MSRGSALVHEDVAHTPSLPNFKLAEKLGQGAFGSVYKALNWSTGETCAVKQIDLSHIPKSELPDIMQEIDLLKNLHHSNIVQYRGYARTDSALYIILEYCENGSLATIIKKFGRFPESLVGLYTLQVLQGLLYLHDQGVIHRDIKGSNILATKEGSIKLADFGVATRVGGPSDSAVVGSPYWMAPEVVDQTGATTASDIWSLGALVIELLTGKPPYHFLDPMPALFRIVNDDVPPIPQECSAVVRDFLLECFQKDGNLRVGARKLLRHPWMVVAKRQLEGQALERERIVGRRTPSSSTVEEDEERSKGAGSSRMTTTMRTRPKTLYDDTVQQVQEWNEALKAAPTTVPHRLPSSRPYSLLSPDENVPSIPNLLRRPSAELASALSSNPAPNPTNLPSSSTSLAPPTSLTSKRRPSLIAGGESVLPLATIQPRGTGVTRLRRKSPPLTNPLSRETPSNVVVQSRRDDDVEEHEGGRGGGESDNWDSDFEEGISISKIEALDKVSTDGKPIEDEKGGGSDDDSQSTNSLTIRPTPRKVGSIGPKSTSAILSPPSSLNTVMEDYSDLVGEAELDPFEGKVRSLQAQTGSNLDVHKPAQPSSLTSSHIRTVSPSGEAHSRRVSMDKYSESDVDDYSVVFGRSLNEKGPKFEPPNLQTRLSSKSWLGDEDSDEEDPFASVTTDSPTYETDEDNLEANLLRDQIARQCNLVSELLNLVGSGSPDDFEVREAALQITGLLEESRDASLHFVKSHGMLVVIEALQVARSRESLSILLRIVNLIVGSDAESLEKIALVGGCPVVMAFASKRYSREIRLEAALFIGSMARTSLLTLQMFVSCRGLRTLVDMLDDSYNEGKDLIWMAVDGISRVFEMNGPTPRNDFCRILAQEGVLEPLSSVLLNVCGDDDDLAESAKAKIVHVLLLFAQSDHKVKEAMASRAVALRLIKATALLEPELLAILLKTIKNLSMLPAALDVLQNANAIEAIVDLLARDFKGRLGAEIKNHAVNTLFNLCRLSKIRQEEAASAGAIPILCDIVHSDSPLKQFALPILCDFAHASKTCRKLLWQHQGVKFYLLLLKDTFWVNPALEAVFAWLQDEPARVEYCLLESTAVESLVQLFCRTKSTVFENLLEPFHKILRTSPLLAARLAVQSGFVKRIVERLERSSRAVVRLNILRITKTVFDSLAEGRDKDKVVKILLSPVSKVAEQDKAVLSRQLAKSLVAEFAAIKEEGKRSLTRRTSSRRGASEGATPVGPPLESTRRYTPSPIPPTSSGSTPSSRRTPIPSELFTSSRRR